MSKGVAVVCAINVGGGVVVGDNDVAGSHCVLPIGFPRGCYSS